VTSGALGDVGRRAGVGRALARGLAVASLDAPPVAVAWALLLAQAGGGAPRPVELALLAAGVWLGYAADRWLDGRRLGARAATARHRFAARHPGPLAAAWGLVFVLALIAAFLWLDPPLLARGVALAALVATYTLATGAWPDVLRRVVPREVAVGLLFSAAVAIFAWPDGRWSAERGLLVAGLALLAVHNTLTVAVLERRRDRRAGELSAASTWAHLDRRLDPAGGLAALASLLIAVFAAGRPSAAAFLGLAAGSAALVALRRRAPRRLPAALAVDLVTAIAALLGLASAPLG
jgi:hypothetical protein